MRYRLGELKRDTGRLKEAEKDWDEALCNRQQLKKRSVAESVTSCRPTIPPDRVNPCAASRPQNSPGVKGQEPYEENRQHQTVGFRASRRPRRRLREGAVRPLAGLVVYRIVYGHDRAERLQKVRLASV
jgi:hypothetical protein